MSDPGAMPPVPKERPWLQLAVILPASLVLALGCCAAGDSLSRSGNEFLTRLGGVLIMAGLASLLVFVGAVAAGFFRLLVKLFSKGGS